MNAAVLVFAVALQGAASKKVDIVSVTGCLRETAPSTWMVVNATDPVPSAANAPSKDEIPATPPVGKNQFRLIGVSEFNLPQHKDHAVVAKGLYIKGSGAQGLDRLNITSVTSIAPSCPAK
jgi:hypothetical protein